MRFQPTCSLIVLCYLLTNTYIMHSDITNPSIFIIGKQSLGVLYHHVGLARGFKSKTSIVTNQRITASRAIPSMARFSSYVRRPFVNNT